MHNALYTLDYKINYAAMSCIMIKTSLFNCYSKTHLSFIITEHNQCQYGNIAAVENCFKQQLQCISLLKRLEIVTHEAILMREREIENLLAKLNKQ